MAYRLLPDDVTLVGITGTNGKTTTTTLTYEIIKEAGIRCHLAGNIGFPLCSFLDKLEANFDYIIDACDDMNAKVLLVKYAIKNNIKIISSCGTGNKINPEALSITNIWKTYNDPLAKKFRYLLRKEGISYKLPVVSSSEVPILKTKDIIGSISIVPNTAGIFLASYVINDILKEIKNDKRFI